MWERWSSGLDRRTKARHRVVFEYLESRNRHEWRAPFFKHLTNLDGCGEVLVSGTYEYRILGFFMSEGNHFCALLFCYHKDKIYKPPNAFATAVA